MPGYSGIVRASRSRIGDRWASPLASTRERRRVMVRLLLGVLAGVLLLVGCTPEPAPPADPQAPASAAAGGGGARVSGDITIRGCTPAQPLLPANTLDSCGLRIMDPLTSRLYRANSDTGAIEPDLAESVDTTDSQTFTVRLARGRLFHDGTEVKARNVVSAWNWAAYGPNKMAGQSFFAPIEGADQLACVPGAACSKDGRPTAMSGLKVLDDYTFTVRTTKPLTDFAARVSHPVFAPLPDAFFAEDDGKDSFGKLPVGAGPFKIASNTTSEIALERFDGYTGRYPAQIRKVTVRMYDDTAKDYNLSKAYNDVVANRLDFTDVIPTDQLIDDQWQKDLENRFALRDTRAVQQLSFAAGDRQLADPRLRRAISMGIDRQALAGQVFNNTRAPATSWVSPVVPGYRTDACADMCAYDPVAARDLYAAAGGYSGEFVITVSAAGGNKQWADALCNQLTNSLDLDCQVRLLPNQAAVLGAAGSGRATGMVGVDDLSGYLTPEPYLSRYRSDAWHNVGRYSNGSYDQLVTQAAGATSQAAANEAYRRAEQLLAQDPPSVPLWYASTPVGWSNRVTDVKVTLFGTLDLSSIRVK
ncbi:peptide ABC transporter substrate-binding protein [Enemella evansiae]|nr:peptide ABC transporter substrate-binding protein [Enemella evansiae]